jgi:hypothetical protein
MISTRVGHVIGKRSAIHRQSIGKRCASDWQAIGKRSACLRHPCSQHFTTISAPAALVQSAQVQAGSRIATRHGGDQGHPGAAFLQAPKSCRAASPRRKTPGCQPFAPDLRPASRGAPVRGGELDSTRPGGVSRAFTVAILRFRREVKSCRVWPGNDWPSRSRCVSSC